jgi:D-inositol-3-phosphate glycosyltransferase
MTMMKTRKSTPAPPLAFPGAGTRIATLSVHTSPLAQLGGYAAGGMNVYVRETARQLGSLGYSVDIFTRDDGSQPLVRPLEANVRLISLEAGPRERLTKEETIDFLPAFLHAMRNFRQRHDLHYDLLQSHYWQAGWVASLLAPRWGIPHVAMFHTLGEVKNRALLSENESEQRISVERRVAQAADRVICFSDHERKVLTGTYGATGERVAVIPCGVDLQRFRPLKNADCRESLRLGEDPIVLYVGRLEPLKGIDILIQAMAQLEQTNAQLLIVGGDDQAAAEVRQLKRLAASVGMGARIRFVGAVDQAKLPLYYNAADVCVMPSYYESFGLVAVESMACGTPVIGSRVGGLATTIEDGETGYLIPWRCPEPFAERIDLILKNSELRRNLGRSARRSMHRFGWERVARHLAAEYARVWQERAIGQACHTSQAAYEGPSHTACPQ